MDDVKIKLTRDAVCMGDDAEDHVISIRTVNDSDTKLFIIDIAQNYLPHIAGFGHIWDCILNGQKIAIIDGNCVKITPLIDTLTFCENNALHFKYHSATY